MPISIPFTRLAGPVRRQRASIVNRLARVGLLVGLGVAVAGLGRRPALAAPAAPQNDPIVVNSFVDQPDADGEDGLCQSTPDGDCTLRAAVQQAQANEGADTIQLGVGVYHLTLNGVDNTGGDLVISSTLTIVGAGAGQTSVTADYPTFTDRVFMVLPAGQLTLSDLAIEGGQAADDGGGLRNEGTLTITGAIIRNNGADLGGGISNAGRLSLSDSQLNNNAFVQGGGGLANDLTGQAELTRVTVDGSGQAGVAGGGLYNAGQVTVTLSTIAHYSATVTGGGGVYNAGAAWIENSTISENQGKQGGGIYSATGGTLILINATISGNGSERGGSGVHLAGGTVSAYNVTIANNQANTDNFTEEVGETGLENQGGVVYLQNSVVAGNFKYVLNHVLNYNDCFGQIIVAGPVYFRALGCNTVGGGEGALVTVTDASALLGPLADNFGPTRTQALLAGNPAIDGGNSTDAYGCVGPANVPLLTDQRGRPRIIGPRCDAGAVEVGQALFAPLIMAGEAP